VAGGPDGSVYVAEKGAHRVRRIDPEGIVWTVAGTGSPGFSGDGGPALAATLRRPSGVAIGPDGSLYIADTGNHRVRRVAPDGRIDTVAGDGAPRYEGDGGSARSASLNSPTDVAVDPAGGVYILDRDNGRVRRLGSDGNISTVAGADPLDDYHDADCSPDCYGAKPAAEALIAPRSMALDAQGRLYIAGPRMIWRLEGDGMLRPWTCGACPSAPPDMAPGSVSEISLTGRVLPLEDGTVLIDSPGVGLVVVEEGVARRLSASVVSAGMTQDPRTKRVIATGSGGLISFRPGEQASVLVPSPPASLGGFPVASLRSLAVARDGTIYLADRGNGRVLAMTPQGEFRHVAGDPQAARIDGVPATQSRIGPVSSLAADSGGVLYIASDTDLRRVLPSGMIETVRQNLPLPIYSVRVDAQNRVYVFGGRDRDARVVRLNGDGSQTTLVQDSPGAALYFSGVTSRESAPGMAVTAGGTVYVGITGRFSNNPSRILKAGPDGRAPVLIPLETAVFASAIAIGPHDEVVIADGARIRRVLPDGALITWIGNAGWGFEAAELPGTSDLATNFADIGFDPQGGLVVIDGFQIRRVDTTSCPVSPQPLVRAVLEAASLNSNLKLAAGQIISIWGARLGPAEGETARLDAQGRIGTRLAGTSVRVNGVAAPVLYARADQVNAIVPFGVDGRGRAGIEVESNGVSSDRYPSELRRASPALFCYIPGTGGLNADRYASMLNQDGSVNSASNPARLGSIVSIYATGLGITDPPGIDGAIDAGERKAPKRPVTVKVGGIDADLLYVGTAFGLVEGGMQINLRLPAELPAGGNVESIAVYSGPATPQPNRLLFYFTR